MVGPKALARGGFHICQNLIVNRLILKHYVHKVHPILLCIFVILLPIASFSSQVDLGNKISGRIRDAETDKALENVTIFMPYSSIGTSSGIDGRFLLTRIPSGTYDLVFVRLGYERLTISITIGKSDSLYYEISLRAKPIEAKEIEVLGERTPALPTQPIFFPRDTLGSLCVYGASNSIPIGILSTDSALYMYTLETTVIDSQKYLKLWLLYKNLSISEVEFDPINSVSLKMTDRRGLVRTIHADRPDKVLSKIKKADAIRMISEATQKSLESMAKKQTMFAYDQFHFELLLILDQLLHQNKTRGSFEPLTFEPAKAGTLSSSMYETFVSSVIAGILQRFIVYPENSVNGYILFPFPGFGWKAGGETFAESLQYRYTIEILTPNGVRTIDFLPR